MINWFPGHMYQSINKLKEYLNLVDVVIELRDSRAPVSTENHLFTKFKKNKKHIIILTKKDLSDPYKTNKYKENIINNTNTKILSLNLKKDNLNELKYIISNLNIKRNNKLNNIIKIMFIGIPNCGKSTLINNMLGRKATLVANKPGITRQINWYKTKELYLMDTPGILWGKIKTEISSNNLCLIGSISDKVYDKEHVCSYLLDFLKINYSEYLKKLIRGKDIIHLTELDSYELMDLINSKFCFDNSNKYYNLSNRILNDFQKGKLGRITLDIF